MFLFDRDNNSTFHFTDWFNNVASLSSKFLTKPKANPVLLSPHMKLKAHTLLTGMFLCTSCRNAILPRAARTSARVTGGRGMREEPAQHALHYQYVVTAGWLHRPATASRRVSIRPCARAVAKKTHLFTTDPGYQPFGLHVSIKARAHTLPSFPR